MTVLSSYANVSLTFAHLNTPDGEQRELSSSWRPSASRGAKTIRKCIVTACAENSFMYWDPHSRTPFFKPTGNNARFGLGGTNSLAVSLSKGEVISALGGHADGESVEAVAFVNIVGAVDGTNAPAGSASSNTVVTGATDGKVCT